MPQRVDAGEEAAGLEADLRIIRTFLEVYVCDTPPVWFTNHGRFRCDVGLEKPSNIKALRALKRDKRQLLVDHTRRLAELLDLMHAFHDEYRGQAEAEPILGALQRHGLNCEHIDDADKYARFREIVRDLDPVTVVSLHQSLGAYLHPEQAHSRGKKRAHSLEGAVAAVTFSSFVSGLLG